MTNRKHTDADFKMDADFKICKYCKVKYFDIVSSNQSEYNLLAKEAKKAEEIRAKKAREAEEIRAKETKEAKEAEEIGAKKTREANKNLFSKIFK